MKKQARGRGIRERCRAEGEKHDERADHEKELFGLRVTGRYQGAGDGDRDPADHNERGGRREDQQRPIKRRPQPLEAQRQPGLGYLAVDVGRFAGFVHHGRDQLYHR
jgi:hypothetical protein